VDSPTVALLGPLEFFVAGEPVEVSSLKQRALLAVLALEGGRVVSRDQLIAALWGEAVPASAANSLEAHVSRLRRIAAFKEALRTRRPGYLLDANTDLRRFEELRSAAVGKAASGDVDGAVDDLERALALWRGPALADLLDEPFAEREAPRLDELRLSATEELMRCRIKVGAYADAVATLEALVAEHPLRESLRELLMVALYGAERQADALAVYRATQRLFRDELGLDPSPRLRRIEQAILRHDESLLATPSAKASVEERPRPARRRLRWPWLAAAAAAVAVAAVTGTLLEAAGAHRSLPPVPTRPIPLGNHVVAQVSVALPACCAFGFGRVWAVGHHDGMLNEIDSETNRVVGKYHVVGFQGLAPLAAVGSLWLPSAGGDFVRFDPVRRRVVARFPINAAEIAWGYGAIWATTRDHQLVRIDYGRNRITSRLQIAPGANDFDDGIAIGYGSVSVTLTDRSTLLRIDPTTMKVVARITGFGNTYGWMPVTAGDGSIWIYHVAGSRGRVFRVDPYTNKILKRITVGRRNVAWPNGTILNAGGYVWSCDAGNTLSKIDPQTNRVAGWYTLPDEVCSEVAFGNDSIWFSLYDHSLIYRINPS
jgi:DNA-binding SARP family transcriptional activator